MSWTNDAKPSAGVWTNNVAPSDVLTWAEAINNWLYYTVSWDELEEHYTNDTKPS